MINICTYNNITIYDSGKSSSVHFFNICMRNNIAAYDEQNRFWSEGSESKVYHEKDSNKMFSDRLLSNMIGLLQFSKTIFTITMLTQGLAARRCVGFNRLVKF